MSLHASISAEIPLQGGNNGYINLEGQTDPQLAQQLVGFNYVTSDYFHTFQIPLVAGRSFSPQDLDRTAEASQRLFDLYNNASDPSKMKIPPDLALVSVISQDMARISERAGEGVHSL